MHTGTCPVIVPTYILMTPFSLGPRNCRPFLIPGVISQRRLVCYLRLKKLIQSRFMTPRFLRSLYICILIAALVFNEKSWLISVSHSQTRESERLSFPKVEFNYSFNCIGTNLRWKSCLRYTDTLVHSTFEIMLPLGSGIVSPRSHISAVCRLSREPNDKRTTPTNINHDVGYWYFTRNLIKLNLCNAFFAYIIHYVSNMFMYRLFTN